MSGSDTNQSESMKLNVSAGLHKLVESMRAQLHALIKEKGRHDSYSIF